MLNSKTIITQLLEDITVYRSLRQYEDPRIVAIMDEADYRQNITRFLWKLYHKFFDQSGQLKPNALGSEALFNDMLQSLTAVEDPEFRFLNAQEQEEVMTIQEELCEAQAIEQEAQLLEMLTGDKEGTWQDAAFHLAVKTNALVKEHLKLSNIKVKINTYFQKFEDYVALNTRRYAWLFQDLLRYKGELKEDVVRYRQSQSMLELTNEAHKKIWQEMARYIGGLNKLIDRIDRFYRSVCIVSDAKPEYRVTLQEMVFDAHFPVNKIELVAQLFAQGGMSKAQFNCLIARGESQENFTERSLKSA
ncbi:hypothetical protein QR692_10085 [Lactococcus petauri]|uniref:hypothetical protein n=1 Tax=Lactococcus petauri TaxID=1940789 RepID=UPI0020789A4E|nr:hypothetical protein [Lactococcus petauri]USI65331.1 hypothetical protein LMK05_10970 [Lactococcus petauri]USI67826.1 hypothetical protein LMK04_10205 [Lactococcus petauri]WJE12487.1 hypothetical protein QR692_10085 [Lactococcus petauri]